MNAEEIAGLIERLEAATGPDIMLDMQIRQALSVKCIGYLHTSSVDHALRLKPQGFHFFLMQVRDGVHRASIFKPGDKGYLRQPKCGDGATPAIALCIAALKAQARHD